MLKCCKLNFNFLGSAGKNSNQVFKTHLFCYVADEIRQDIEDAISRLSPW